MAQRRAGLGQERPVTPEHLVESQLQPTRAGEANSLSTTTSPATGSPAAERTGGILLVDDHPENLAALEAVLEPLGERMVSADSGEQALRALLREEFAVILLDVDRKSTR